MNDLQDNSSWLPPLRSRLHRFSGAKLGQRIAFNLFVATRIGLSSTTAVAEYPDRPIRYIIPSAPGGGPDTGARIVLAELSKQMRRQFVVDNRPGASGMIGTEMIAKAAPDGYTIGHGNLTTMAINRSVLSKLPYRPEDFQTVIQLYFTPNLLAVTTQLPLKSVPELIDYAKKNPDRLFCASNGSGTSIHLGCELFKSMTGTQLIHVPFKTIALAITDLTAGRVQVIFDNISSIGPHVTAGRVRGLAVTSPKRVPAYPDLPAVAEAGVPGYEVTSWAGVIVPAAMPKAIVFKLNTEFNAVLVYSTVRQKLTSLGLETAGGTPVEFAEHIKREAAKWAEVVKRSGAKVD